MIHGYALLSVNHEGKGKLYDLNEEQKPVTFLDFSADWTIELENEDIEESLTPENQKDVLLMVFFSYHYEGGRSFYDDDFVDWLEIESFQVMESNHEECYLSNLRILVGLYDSNEDIPDKELQESESFKISQLIGEYEEFYGKAFERKSAPNKVDFQS